MIYRFRILLDSYEDVFRDIEIEGNNTMEDLHNAIVQAFGFDGTEMASFYLSNDKWEEGDEIALFDMGNTAQQAYIMNETYIENTVSEDQTKLIYVYDFLLMWTFLVELAEITEAEDGQSYPNLMFAHGQIPAEAPDKEFSSEPTEDTMDADDNDDDIEFDPNDYENLDFDENWN